MPQNRLPQNWSHSKGKRVFDASSAALALILFSPLMLLVAALVKLSSKGPILFRQTRMGKQGQTFEILKFRSMLVVQGGPGVTRSGDSRLTPIGRFLRAAKLDELPQLFNVVKGEMSLVGPRPKLPHHQTYTLRVLPGVTGAASLAFRREECFLHHVPEHALDTCQVEILMPLKRELDEEYMRQASFFSDLRLLFHTITGVGHKTHAERVSGLQLSLLALTQAVGTTSPQSAPAQPRTPAFSRSMALR